MAGGTSIPAKRFTTANSLSRWERARNEPFLTQAGGSRSRSGSGSLGLNGNRRSSYAYATHHASSSSPQQQQQAAIAPYNNAPAATAAAPTTTRKHQRAQPLVPMLRHASNAAIKQKTQRQQTQRYQQHKAPSQWHRRPLAKDSPSHRTSWLQARTTSKQDNAPKTTTSSHDDDNNKASAAMTSDTLIIDPKLTARTTTTIGYDTINTTTAPNTSPNRGGPGISSNVGLLSGTSAGIARRGIVSSHTTTVTRRNPASGNDPNFNAKYRRTGRGLGLDENGTFRFAETLSIAMPSLVIRFHSQDEDSSSSSEGGGSGHEATTKSNARAGPAHAFHDLGPRQAIRRKRGIANKRWRNEERRSQQQQQQPNSAGVTDVQPAASVAAQCRKGRRIERRSKGRRRAAKGRGDGKTSKDKESTASQQREKDTKKSLSKSIPVLYKEAVVHKDASRTKERVFQARFSFPIAASLVERNPHVDTGGAHNRHSDSAAAAAIAAAAATPSSRRRSVGKDDIMTSRTARAVLRAAKAAPPFSPHPE